MAILNTSILKVEDHIIDFGDEKYNIPGEIPVELYFRLMERNKIENTAEQFKEGMEIIYEIFKIRNSDMTREKFNSLITINIMTGIINLIFADMTAEETLERLKESREEIKDGKKKPNQAEN
jgi:hypothetical protein